MSFGDVKSVNGLKKFNAFLADRSYVEGFVPSQTDVAVFAAVGSAPSKAEYPHVARWYKHIASYSDAERKNLVKGEKPVDHYVGASSGKPAPAGKPAGKPAAKDDEEDDVDLFGSGSDEEEDAEAARVREERLKAYAEKKSKKPALIAKTSVLLDVKPWDDETDMEAMLKGVKTIEMEGLVWGASKLVPVGYGINKLQILCVVEDEKVSIDELQERITESLEEYVQSCDIAAMNKI